MSIEWRKILFTVNMSDNNKIPKGKAFISIKKGIATQLQCVITIWNSKYTPCTIYRILFSKAYKSGINFRYNSRAWSWIEKLSRHFPSLPPNHWARVRNKKFGFPIQGNGPPLTICTVFKLIRWEEDIHSTISESENGPKEENREIRKHTSNQQPLTGQSSPLHLH